MFNKLQKHLTEQQANYIKPLPETSFRNEFYTYSNVYFHVFFIFLLQILRKLGNLALLYTQY